MRILRWVSHLWAGILLVTVLLIGLLLGLRLLLPFTSTQPALMHAVPNHGDVGVAPHAQIVLQFNRPMNPPSVAQALRITPPAPVALVWDTDRTTLTISPTTNLQPDSTYHVTIDLRAQSRLFRALDEPIDLSFRTAPAPVVVAVFPTDGAGDVPLTTPISVKFSRSIVPTTSLALAMALPQLQFDPPLDGSAIWIDPTTLLFRPTTQLLPGTSYRATLAADLSDVSGSRLGNSFSWTFSTPAPHVLSVAPAAGSRSVPPRAPLTLRLSQPLDLASVQASMNITPTTTGALDALTLSDGTQLITYTPALEWQLGATYTVTLQPGAAPTTGNLPLLEPSSWSFTVASQPILTGRFPGEGQTLPPGQDIRLTFNAPIDGELLRNSVRFTPPVNAIDVTATGNEARITADLRAATPYTMTILASLADRHGIRLDRDYQLRFLTAPASPALALPTATGHIIRLLPGQTTAVPIQRTNLSALTLSLYQLDAATVVRTMAFRDADWSTFRPERYAQPQLRSWTIPLADPLNVPVEEQVRLSATPEEQPLAPGAYYLRIRTPEGPRADLLVLVSRARLTFQEGAGQFLIWATDILGGTPIEGLPIALYQDSALLRRGVTDQNGVWVVDRSSVSAPHVYVALAEGDQPAVAIRAPRDRQAALEQYRLFLTTDRAIYRPGDHVALAGFVRSALGQAAPTLVGLPVNLSALQTDISGRVYQETLNLAANGLISDTFTLPPNARTGEYILTATFGRQVFQTQFLVQPAVTQPLQLRIDAPTLISGGEPVPVTVEARTPQGLPVAGAVISWTLTAVPAPFPSLDGYALGDEERAYTPGDARGGQAQAGANGRANITIAGVDASHVPLRYRLVAHVTEPGGPRASAETTFLVAPAPAYAAVRLPSRIVNAGQPAPIELLTLTPDGRPLPQTAVQVEIARRSWTRRQNAEPANESSSQLRPQDDIVLTRSLVTGADGTATLAPSLRRGGEYQVRVSVVGPNGQRVTSTTSLWVAAPRFVDWGERIAEGPLLIADRPEYRPGDTATLLVTTPFAEALALVTIERGDRLEGQVRTIRAGEPFSVTIEPGDVPTLRIGVLLISPRGTAPALDDGHLSAVTTVPVRSEAPPLFVTVSADQPTYMPGSTATLTITTLDDRAAPVPADVILSIVGTSGPTTPQPPQPPGDASLPLQPAARIAGPLATHSIYWNPGLSTGNSGVLTTTITLPASPIELQALAWAASADGRMGQVRGTLVVTHPVELRVEAPAFFRAGDMVELAAQLVNTSPVTQEVRVALAAGGVEPQPGAPLTQRVSLAPGASQRVSWPASVEPASRAELHFSVHLPNRAPQAARVERPILPAGGIETTSVGALVQGQLTQQIDIPGGMRGAWGQLEIDLAPSTTALAQSVARTLASQQGSTLDAAGVLLISATYSDTRPLAAEALAQIAGNQNGDNGWGWWPGGRSQPAVTVAVAEALVAANRAGLEVPEVTLERGIAALNTVLQDPASSPDMRAHILYVLALHGQADANALRGLADQPTALSAQGLAHLLLARPAAQAAQDRAILSRLESLAQHQDDVVRWPACQDQATLCTDVTATAVAAVALEHVRSGGELVPAARRWLATTRSIDGWPNGYESARALAALAGMEPPADVAGTRYVVALNGTELLDRPFSTAISTTHVLTVPLDQLRVRNDLTIASSGGSVFASYRLIRAAALAAPHVNGVGLLREYLDPQTGSPIGSTQLRPGQLVRARLTILVTADSHFLTITDPLPVGVVVVQSDNVPTFDHITADPDQFILAVAKLPAGVYEYSYLLRAVLPGSYAVPPPQAVSAQGQARSTGNTTTVEIAAPR